MLVPYVIDNQTHKMKDALEGLLKEHEGRCLDIAKAYFNNLSERSNLSPESQPIQDAIDAVLFKCYGLSDEDAEYVKRRLKEML
jgi:hypothetical protein